MTESQKNCINEIQKIMLSVNEVVEKYGLIEEFIACLAVGFIDVNNSYVDEEGGERANMNLLSSFSVTNEEELDDLLSYCMDSYRQDIEDSQPDTSTIDYWINLSNEDSSVN